MPRGFPNSGTKKLTFNKFIAAYEGDSPVVKAYKASHIERKGRVTPKTLADVTPDHVEVWVAFLAAGGK